MFGISPLFRDNASEPFNMDWLKAAFAEFLGTYFLVFVPTLMVTSWARLDHITGATGSSVTHPGLVISVALAFAFTLMALVAAIGHISGAHCNPAVTLGFLVVREIPAIKGVIYIVAQFLGGILASVVVYAITGDAGQDSGLGSNALSNGIGDGEGFFAEAIITAFFTFVVFATAVDKQYAVDFKVGAAAPLAIGAALGAGHLCMTLITGTSMNPARALGPWIVAEDFQRGWWACLLGPFVGGVIGVLMYHLVFFDTRSEEELIEIYGSKNEDRSSDVKVIAGQAVSAFGYSSSSYSYY